MPTYTVCATSGDDCNDGITKPFLTIQRAAEIALPGDTVLVQPGIYRERVSPTKSGTSTAPITYISAVPNEAIIRGSVPWLPTDNSGNIWSGILPETLFTDTSAIDGANPFKVPVCVTPYGRNGAPEFKSNTYPNSDPKMVYSLGQVFVDDQMLIQCPFYNEMVEKENSWFYDTSLSKLYIHISEFSQNIEVTNQRRVFAPHQRGLRYITVDGFVVERCGNNYPNQFWMIPSAIQAGMIGTRSGRYWTIQNNIIRNANGVGIDWGNEGSINQDLEVGTNGQASGSFGHIIQNNTICDNGAAGTASYMGKSFTFSKNIIERNNNLLFTGKRRWESAGVKVHQPTNSIITNNIIRNNYCHGIWSDQGAGNNSIFKNNIIMDNMEGGINFEIGTNTTGNVMNNIFLNNNYGVTFVTSGGVNVSNNLFLGSKICDINTVLFTRTTDKWDSNNLQIFNNIFFGENMYLQLSKSSATIPSSRFLNNNIYSGDNRFSLLPISGNKTSTVFSLEDWIACWKSINTTNYDEQSIVSKNSFTFDENTKILTLNIQSSVSGSGPGSIDIYGNPIKNGENIIQIQM
jgi:hypothetical protein